VISVFYLYVYLSVSSLYISETTRPNVTKFSLHVACGCGYSPPLAALRYVMYFRFCGCRPSCFLPHDAMQVPAYGRQNIQWRFYVGARGHRPPKSCPGPQIFFRVIFRSTFDVIGSIVISLSRCCLANDEGAAPQYFFLEPPLKISLKGAWSHHVTHFKFLDP